MSASHPSDAELSRRQRLDARLESDAVRAFDADGESIQYRGPEIPGPALPVPAQEAETRIREIEARTTHSVGPVLITRIDHFCCVEPDDFDWLIAQARLRSHANVGT